MKRDEDIRVGDTVIIFGVQRRVVAIKPYVGPYDFVIGIAVCEPKISFSLCKGDTTPTP